MDKQKYPLTVLYVEDEIQIANLINAYLQKRFERVYMAHNGEDGLALFKKYNPDFVITDIQMPKKNGLDMSCEIREISKSVPIIITTAFDDSKYLWDAIKAGINHYVIKPLDSCELREALEKTAKSIMEKKELESAREALMGAKEQEIELLTYKEKYHSSQQESAFKKQLKIINDELNRRTDENFFVETYYKPLDILSGDSYGTLEISEGVYFFYIIDAMGKGLSASVTSIQSMAFINHAARISFDRGSFDFRRIIHDYLVFIKAHLIEHEMVCAHFLLLDRANKKAEYSSYGMPPLTIERRDGTIVELLTNNPPIMDIFSSLEIESVQIDDVCKILIYSDGLDESYTHEALLYGTRLNGDLKESCCLKNFLELFHMHTREHKDDVSIIFIKLLDFEQKGLYETGSSLHALDEISDSILQGANRLGFGDEYIGELKFAIAEIFMNALEHGNLGIDYATKRALIESGSYDELLNSKLSSSRYTSKKIKASLSTCKKEPRVLRVDIEDEGDGFNFSEFFKYMSFDDIIRYSGRGILMTESMVDGIFYNKKGNRATILKREEKK